MNDRTGRTARSSALLAGALMALLVPQGALAQEPAPAPAEGGDEATPDPFAQDVEEGGDDEVPVVDQSQAPNAEAVPQPPPAQQGYGQPQQYGGQPQYGQQPPQYGPPQYAAQQQRRRHRERYDPNREYPSDARIFTRRKTGLIIAGAIMFAVPYLMTVSVWAAAADVGDDLPATLLVPAIGPFLTIPDAGSSAGRTVLAWDGALQTAGLTLFVVGLAAKTRYVEYWADAARAGGFAVTPRFGTQGGGFDLRYHF